MPSLTYAVEVYEQCLFLILLKYNNAEWIDACVFVWDLVFEDPLVQSLEVELDTILSTGEGSRDTKVVAEKLEE